MRPDWKGVGKYAASMIPGLVAFAVIVGLAVFFIPFNHTESMPYGWYLRLPARNIEVGDLVEMDNPFYRVFGVEAESGLLKRVTGIEDGLYMVRGEHVLSYDSRLFGLIGEEYISHRLIPLWTFDEVPSWMAWLIRIGEKDIKE